jgi:hypothetical protein
MGALFYRKQIKHKLPLFDLDLLLDLDALDPSLCIDFDLVRDLDLETERDLDLETERDRDLEPDRDFDLEIERDFDLE